MATRTEPRVPAQPQLQHPPRALREHSPHFAEALLKASEDNARLHRVLGPQASATPPVEREAHRDFTALVQIGLALLSWALVAAIAVGLFKVISGA